jgi:catechol 2,3-dioxygenase-like lactoylglutathione lyase family enzyme
MRLITWLLAGFLAAPAMQSAPPARGRIISVNHVAITVENFDEAIRFYSEKLGMREVWRQTMPDGRPPNLAYVQVGPDTFIEISRGGEGAHQSVAHVGFRVDDMAAALARMKQSGVTVAESRAGQTANVTSAANDPWGLRLELLEVRPDSLQGKATTSWASLAQPTGHFVGINHAAIAFDNFEEASRFYTQTLGFREVWKQANAEGRVNISMLQVGAENYIEPVRTSATQKAGAAHMSLNVDNMEAILARLKQNGVKVADVRASATASKASSFTDPWGLTIQMLEVGPDSIQGKARQTWQ